jgi:Domain of unknown function (DUF4193)
MICRRLAVHIALTLTKNTGLRRHELLGEFPLPPVRCSTGNTKPTEKRCTSVATDYDELRTDVKESQENSLEALKSAKAPDAKSVVQELDEADALDGLTPGGEFIAEELVVQVIPQADDEFTCYSCFLVRHRSQKAREKDGHAYCVECEG